VARVPSLSACGGTCAPGFVYGGQLQDHLPGQDGLLPYLRAELRMDLAQTDLDRPSPVRV
jgi:hypothetical protein